MRVLFILFCGSLLCSCATKPSRHAQIQSELDNYFSDEFPRDEPGGAVLLMKGDTVIFSKGYGLADLKTHEAVTPKTLFNLGSVTKTFVANAILMLQEQGKLTVEDSLFQYFPEFKDKTIAQKVKIKHLLTHTSGLPDTREVNKDTLFYLTAKDAENWKPITLTDSLLFEPGSQFEYSNPAFNGLALIVEKVSGIPWQEFVTQHIFKPAGMNNSTITNGAHPDKGVSHGYVKNHGEWIEDDYNEEPTFPAAGNGGVWSSIEELANYEKAIQQFTFLSSTTTADSRTIKHFDNWKGDRPFTAGWSWFKPDVTNGIFTPIIGWSWFIGKTPNGSGVVGHTGTQGGFMCSYISIPEKKILAVVLVNTPRDIYAYSDKVISILDK